MAEGDGVIYNNFKEQLMEEFFNLASGGDTIMLSLHSTYTADIDAHTQWADVSGTETSGSNYVSKGGTLANQDSTQDDANDLGKFDADNETWSSLGPLATATPAACILWDEDAAGDELICSWTLGTTTTNGGDYTLAFHGDGIITLT